MDSTRFLERIDSGELKVEEEFDGVRVSVEMEAVDQLAVLLKRIAMDTPMRRGVLQNQARAVVEKLTYLGSGLKVVEVDGIANAAQIRSAKPGDDGYVEVMLRGGNYLSLEKRPGGTLHLSKTNWKRLVEDLNEVLKK